MPERLRALRTFSSEEYGKIRAGEIFWAEDAYAKKSVAMGHSKREALPENAPVQAPQKQAVVTETPDGGKVPEPESESDPEPEATQDVQPENTQDAHAESGQARQSFASRQARRSRKKTVTTSGEKPAQS